MSLLHDHIDEAYAEIKRLKAELAQQKANNRSRLERLAVYDAENKRRREALEPDAVAQAMQQVWDWYCDDGCHPPEFTVKGAKRYQMCADFIGGAFALLVSDTLKALAQSEGGAECER